MCMYVCGCVNLYKSTSQVLFPRPSHLGAWDAPILGYFLANTSLYHTTMKQQGSCTCVTVKCISLENSLITEIFNTSLCELHYSTSYSFI